MSQRRNINVAGHGHEITFSCFDRLPLLSKDRTRQWLAESVNAACESHAFNLWAYVFMPEHVHLVVCPNTPDHDIADFRKAIKAPVGRKAIGYLREHHPEWLPRLQRTRGRRLETAFWLPGGGYDRNIVEPRTAARMIEYVHQNPVRRGLVRHAADWHWSSAAWHRDRTPGPCVVHRITGGL